MSLLFRPLSVAEVMASWKASAHDVLGTDSADELRAMEARKAEGPRMAYKGGKAAAEYFIKPKQGESPAKYQDRIARIHNVRIVKPIVDFFSYVLYGQQPKRDYWLGQEPTPAVELARQWLKHYRNPDEEPEPDTSKDEQSSELASWFKWHHQQNAASLRMSKAARYRIRDGRAACRVRLAQDGGPNDPGEIHGLRYDIWKRENAIPIMDPTDAEVCVAVLEFQEFGGPSQYILHTAERWTYVTPDMTRDLGGGLEQPTGMIPWAFFGDGESMVQDAVLDQAHAINLYSIYDLIKLAQGFSVPVVTGEIKNRIEKTRAGEEGTKVGPLDMLHLAAGSDFTFATPSPPLDHHMQGIENFLKESFASHSMPSDFTSDGGSVERPLAKLLGMMPTEMARLGLVAEAEQFERDKANVEARYASVYAQELGAPEFNPDSDQDEFSFSVSFQRHFIPTDEADREARDSARVMAGLMLPEEYLMRRPENADLSPEQIAAKAYELEQEKERKNQNAVGGFDLLNEAGI